MVGGCQCGQVRYQITGPPPAVYACHCRECQKQSTSAFALSMPVAREHFSLHGNVAKWQRQSYSGGTTDCHFCPDCGTRIYHSSSRSPALITVKSGSLDDQSSLIPIAHLWVARKQSWLLLDENVAMHQTQPEDISAWRAALVAQQIGA